jgi:hypothetical protein
MIKKRGKEIYQPPYAQDLSGLGAIGQVQPMGHCRTGNVPTINWCNDGAVPAQTGHTCNSGGYPDDGGCSDGSVVSNSCISGYGFSAN